MRVISIIIYVVSIISLVVTNFAQSTSFTYQGQLNFNNNPASGKYDFEFALFNSASGGSQVGSPLTRSSVAVANGNFTVTLDFGNVFPGDPRFLEIRVRQAGAGGYTTLSPRQNIGSSPYSLRSLSSDTANVATNAMNAVALGGVIASLRDRRGRKRASRTLRDALNLSGTPCRTQTCDLLIRSQTLYSTELRVHTNKDFKLSTVWLANGENNNSITYSPSITVSNRFGIFTDLDNVIIKSLNPCKFRYF